MNKVAKANRAGKLGMVVVLRALFFRALSSQALRWSAGSVIIWRLCLEACNQVAPFVTAAKESAPLAFGLGRWNRWDGGWYTDIIINGYHYSPTETGQQNFAFFPGFPVITRGVSDIFGVGPTAAALLINMLLMVAVCYLVYKLAELLVAGAQQRAGRRYPSKAIARLSVVALLVYPASLFFGAVYAEALLALGVVGAFYFVLKDRLYAALPFVILATATKSVGLAMLPALALIVFLRWRERRQPLGRLVRNLIPLGAGVLGIAGYMAYLWLRFGDPLLFYKVQEGWGRNSDAFFLESIYERYYAHIFDMTYFGNLYTYLLNLFVMLIPFVSIGTAIWIGRRLKLWWPLVLAVFTLGLPLSTGIMESLNRYAIGMAPLLPLIIMLLYEGRKKIILYTVLSIFAVLLAIFTIGFTSGSYFSG